MALAIFLATGVTIQAQDRLTQYKVRNADHNKAVAYNISSNQNDLLLYCSKVILELLYLSNSENLFYNLFSYY